MPSEYRYHKVSPKFWSDRKVLTWDDDTRLLALYLLTCEHRTTEGLFRLPKAYIAADLGWTMERLAQPFAKLLEDGFIQYDETVSVMLLTNALKWNPTDNPNQAKAAVKSIEELPETPLLSEFQRLAERFDQRLAEQLAQRYDKPPTPTPTPTPTLKRHDYAHARESAEAEETHVPEPGELERTLDELVRLYEQYSPVSGKQAVGARVRRRQELGAALRAGCSRELLEGVIREQAPLDMPPWELRKEAIRRAGFGATRASPPDPEESPGLAAALRSARKRLEESGVQTA